ncbi:MAG: hypothetical protein ACYDC5_10310 [Candidatus Dormibacteria bacterium]
MPSALPGGPTRLLVVGDTHGNHLHWKHVVLPATRKHQMSGIVQLGDFGYWHHDQRGPRLPGLAQ